MCSKSLFQKPTNEDRIYSRRRPTNIKCSFTEKRTVLLKKLNPRKLWFETTWNDINYFGRTSGIIFQFGSLPCIVFYHSPRFEHDHYITACDVMHLTIFGVYKVRVWHPNMLNHVITEVNSFIDSVIKPCIDPLLPEKHIKREILQYTSLTKLFSYKSCINFLR